uniref:hypothetical protein n=1 Tax=Cyanobium sp. TaxID=2164130 RepID=UPI0040487F2E
MAIQAARENEEVPGIKGGSSVMDNNLWMLVPWAVFALALLAVASSSMKRR